MPHKPKPTRPAFRRRHLNLAVLAACALGVGPMTLSSVALAQIPSYYRAKMLPALPGQGWTMGLELNDAAEVAGFTQMGLAVGWSASHGLVTLGSGQAMGIAPSTPTLVGWNRDAFGIPQAYAWTLGGSSAPLGNLYAGVPAYESFAHAINDAGWVLASGRDSINDFSRLLLLRPGESALDLGESGTGTYWDGGAADGIVAGSIRVQGGAYNGYAYSGVVWTEAQGLRSFRVHGGETFVEGVNGNGWAVGSTLLPDAQGHLQGQGFVHDAIANQTLFGWHNFLPKDVNDRGLVVGTLHDTGTQQRISAAAWMGDEVVDLNTRTVNLGYYELYRAVGVNAQGQILAYGGPTGPGSESRPPDIPALSTFILSECLRCGQITPNPNPLGTLLDVAPDWFDAFNEQDYSNIGTLQIGTLVVNLDGAVLRNTGTLDIYGGGTLLNRGQLVNEASGHLNVTGSLRRSADSAAWNGGFVTIGAVGQMHDEVGASWVDEPGATFIQNGGTATLAGYWGADRSTWEQRAGAFTTLPDSLLAFESATIRVDGMLTVGGGMELLPNLAQSPGQGSALQVTGALVLGNGGTLYSAFSTIDVAGGQFVNAGGTLNLGDDNLTWVRAGGTLRLEGGSTHNYRNALLTIDGAASSLSVLAGASLSNVSRLDLYNGAELTNTGTVNNRLDGFVFIDSAVARSQGDFFNEGHIDVTGGGALLEVGGPAATSGRFVNLGSISLGQGAEMRIAGQADLYGDIQVDSDSTVRVDGGQLWIGSGGSIQGGGKFVQDDGSTFVDGLIAQPEISFWGGSVRGSGILRGRTIFGMDVVHDPNLRVQAGSSPGTLTIDGDLIVNGALMEIEVGDFRRYDRLVVTGSLEIGRLDAVLLPEAGYTPDLNDRFDWIAAAGGTYGAAPTLDASALGGGWTASLSGSRITLGHPDVTPWGPDAIGAGEPFVLDAGVIAEIESLRRVASAGDVELRGFVALRNDAVLDIDGGSFTVAAGGRLTSRGWIGHSGQSFVNAGLVRNYEDGQMVMTGPFTNLGLLENAGAWQQSGRLDNGTGARVVNYGMLDAIDVLNAAGGQFTNTGTFTHGGQFSNEAGGRFENSGSMTANGPIENRGEFIVSGSLQNNAMTFGPAYYTGSILNTEGGVFTVEAGGSVSGPGTYFQRAFPESVTRVNGTLAASDITILGGMLTGSGTLVGPVTLGSAWGSGATVQPGNSPGTLTIDGDLDAYYTTFDIELAGPTLYDRVVVSGDARFTGGLVNFLLHTPDGISYDYRPAPGDGFTWLTVGGTVDGLNSLGWTLTVVGDGWQSTMAASGWGSTQWIWGPGPTDGVSIAFYGDRIEFGSLAPVPEPETWAMLLAGLGLVGWSARRRP